MCTWFTIPIAAGSWRRGINRYQMETAAMSNLTRNCLKKFRMSVSGRLFTTSVKHWPDTSSKPHNCVAANRSIARLDCGMPCETAAFKSTSTAFQSTPTLPKSRDDQEFQRSCRFHHWNQCQITERLSLDECAIITCGECRPPLI